MNELVLTAGSKNMSRTKSAVIANNNAHITSAGANAMDVVHVVFTIMKTNVSPNNTLQHA